MSPFNSLAFIFAFSSIALAANKDPDLSKSAMELIRQNGYDVEQHDVQTADGYILTMFRIPRGKNQPITTAKRPIVFLMHGFEDSCTSWVLNSPKQSAGFLFADAGFDVWLGNARGTIYGRNHSMLSVNAPAFWKFSWAQMIPYDLESMVPRAAEVSGGDTVYYVGYGQGAMIMFGKLARNPNFAKRIRRFFALAPLTTLRFARGGFKALALAYYPDLIKKYNSQGDAEFAITSADYTLNSNFIATQLCDSDEGREFCEKTISNYAGTVSNQLNATRLPVYLAHLPGGTSIRNVVHLTQMLRHGQFKEFDYDSTAANQKAYGQDSPPGYDMSQITTPTHIYWSQADYLANRRDIPEILVKALKPQTLKENRQVPNFNHLDFVWGQRAAAEVYTPIIKTIQQEFPIKG